MNVNVIGILIIFFINLLYPSFWRHVYAFQFYLSANEIIYCIFLVFLYQKISSGPLRKKKCKTDSKTILIVGYALRKGRLISMELIVANVLI